MHGKTFSHVDVLLFVFVLSDLEDKLSRSSSLSSLNLLHLSFLSFKNIVLIFFVLDSNQTIFDRTILYLSANQNFYWSKQNIRKFERKNKACFAFWSGPIRERAIWDLSARQSREFCTELKSTMRLWIFIEDSLFSSQIKLLLTRVLCRIPPIWTR